MTLELCNWVVHMGNWYKVLKGWGAHFHGHFSQDACSAFLLTCNIPY